MLGNPKKATAIASIFASIVGLDLLEHINSLRPRNVGPSGATVTDTKPKYNLIGLTLEHIVGNIAIQAPCAYLPRSTAVKSIPCCSRETVVELRHQKVEICLLIPQNLVIRRIRNQIYIYGGMCQFVPLSKCIHLLTKKIGHG